MNNTKDMSFVMSMLGYGCFVAIYYSFPLFIKMCRAPFLDGSKILSEKSNLIDNDVAKFRAKFL